MKKNLIIGIGFCFIFFIFIQAISWIEIQHKRQNLRLTYQSPQSHVSADVLKIIAGEFRGVWADYLLLEIGSFIGSNQIGTQADWKNIQQTFTQSYVLDPYFQQTYIYVQGILPWGAKMYHETIDFLSISKKHRLWDWRPGYYMGFDYYYFLNDYAKASQELLETGKIEGAPALAAILGARFAQKTQRTEAAILMLQQMLQNEEFSDSDHLELQKRLTALEGVSLLQKAVTYYYASHQHYPSLLETLIQEKIISTIPDNPYAKQYFYDPITGKVDFDQIK